jgi:threonine/homoserine/homoserine lactone efflux protein
METKDVVFGCLGQLFVVGLCVVAIIFMDEIETAWFKFLAIAAIIFILYIFYSFIRKK